MTKKKKAADKPRMGRPKLDDPAMIPLNLKVTAAFKAAAEAYAAKHGIAKLGVAVKSAAERAFREDGLIT